MFLNSGLQADIASSLLHDQGVISIEEKKAIRRANVALLLDQYGQTQLADLTGISPALLYQLGKARGKAKRNVNDDYARSIEELLKLGAGWMDVDHKKGGTPSLRSEPPPRTAVEHWPFRLTFARYERLEDWQKQRIEKEVEEMVLGYEARNLISSRPKSRKARNA